MEPTPPVLNREPPTQLPKLDFANFLNIATTLYPVYWRRLFMDAYGRFVAFCTMLGMVLSITYLFGPLGILRGTFGLALCLAAPIAFINRSCLSTRDLYIRFAAVSVTASALWIAPPVAERSPAIAFFLPIAIAAIFTTIVGTTLTFAKAILPMAKSKGL